MGGGGGGGLKYICDPPEDEADDALVIPGDRGDMAPMWGDGMFT